MRHRFWACPSLRKGCTCEDEHLTACGLAQVRGDHGEVVNLLVTSGGKVRATSGALIDLQATQLSR